MENYYELEKCVLDCILARPELMEHNELKDEYFIKYKRLWIFMKSFYEQFKCFDLTAMKTICTNKGMFIHYLSSVQDNDCKYIRFELYQKLLIDLYNQNNEDQAIIETIYKLANNLYVHKINLKTFKESLNKVFGGNKK